MIIAYLNGGLGNQLFQYAAARAVADRLGVQLGLDTRHFEHNPAYNFELGHFNIAYGPLGGDQLPPSRHSKPVGHLLWRGLGLKPRIFREKGLGYNEAISSVRDGAYLKGYWQSERYFAGISEIIRREFAISTPPSPENREMLAEIGGGFAVSLHIRRGDYVTDAATNATHGTCSLDYYRQAAMRIADETGKPPVFYTFSDDPAWARDNLDLPFERRIVDLNDGSTGYEDLRLMSACRHHIIANSSFSWWGAWLNPDPDKIVIAPKRWFAHPKLHNPDIVPDRWLRL